MNVYQKIALTTGLVFIVFIVIIALLDFNNLILIMGLIGVIAVISGTVKVLLLIEKRKSVRRELQELREGRLEEIKRQVKLQKFEYYCPKCPYEANAPADNCPACGGGALKQSGNRRRRGKKK